MRCAAIESACNDQDGALSTPVRTNGTPFDQSGNHRNFLIHAKPVRGLIIAERYGIIIERYGEIELFLSPGFCCPIVFALHYRRSGLPIV